MRGADEVWRAKQSRFLGRLRCEHVKRSAANLAAVQRFLQRNFIDQATACAVNDAHTLFGFRQIFFGEDIARLIGQRRVQGNEISLGQQRVQVRLFHAHFNGAFRRQERVKGNDLHTQAKRAACDDGTDVPCADQAKRLAGDFNAHEAVFRPEASLCLRVCFWQLARQCEHQCYRMFRGGDRIAERGVHDDNALCRSVRDIHIVDADTGTANHLQIIGGVEDGLRDLG